MIRAWQHEPTRSLTLPCPARMSKQLKPMPEFSNAAEEQAFCRLLLKENAMTQKLLDLIPPGKILLEEFMKPMGVSINALSRDVSVPPNRTP